MKETATLEERMRLASEAVKRGHEVQQLRLLGPVTLERAAQWAHVSISTVSAWEAGTLPISPERYEALRTFYIGQINERNARAAEIVAGKVSK